MGTSKDVLLDKIAELEEYKRAYNHLLGYWDSLDKDQQRAINKALNKIFIINKSEQVEELNEVSK